jgi:putative glutamine amidotransferase
MTPPRRHPLVGIPACHKFLDEHPFHAVGEKYITGVIDGAGALPVLIPSLDSHLDPAAVLDRVDGIALSGSPSNVAPHHYNGTPSRPGVLHDRQRDDAVLPLIRLAIETGVPLFAICRGFQELNVAYGGTLYQHLEEVPGRFDHRRDTSLPFAQQYEPRHPVALAPGGQLADIWRAPEVEVNSLHGQGIDRVGDGLVVEATAPDGTVEALRVEGARAFALGVQWHPEWRVLENPFYTATFAAFGEAVRQRAARRERHEAPGEVA